VFPPDARNSIEFLSAFSERFGIHLVIELDQDQIAFGKRFQTHGHD